MAQRRKKPRLFSFSRDVEIGHFEEMLGDIAERRALESVVDAFIDICRTQQVSERNLVPIEAGARHKSAFVRGCAITRLTVLTHYFDEATEVLKAVVGDDNEGVRLYATAALPNTPAETAVPLIERGLADGSWRVRKAAAQAAGALVAPAPLLPILAARLVVETDARVRVQLSLASDFQQQAAKEPG